MAGPGDSLSTATDWDTLYKIGHWLRPCFSPSQPEPIVSRQRWESVVGIASRHMVAPALGWVWAERRDLPSDVAQLFRVLFEMNRDRNATMLTGIGEILVALNRHGIVPVLLKGSAMLVDGTYPDAGIRVLQDCDMLIPDPSLQLASQILAAKGYLPAQKKRTLRGQHHLPMLLNSATRVAVELHYRAMQPAWARIVDSRSCFERGHATEIGGGRAIIPDINDRVAHNIAHLQLQDRRYRSAYPHLRQLLDVAMFRHRHEELIDWQEISERFRRARALHVLIDNLALVEALLGQPAPAVLRGDVGRAERRVRRALSRGPVLRVAKSVQWTLTDAARAFATDPRWLGVWMENARERRSLIGGIRQRARAG